MCILFLLLNLFIKNESVLASVYECPSLVAQMVKKVKVKVIQSCPTLCNPWTIQSMEFSRPEYWSG